MLTQLHYLRFKNKGKTSADIHFPYCLYWNSESPMLVIFIATFFWFIFLSVVGLILFFSVYTTGQFFCYMFHLMQINIQPNSRLVNYSSMQILLPPMFIMMSDREVSFDLLLVGISINCLAHQGWMPWIILQLVLADMISFL